MEKTIVFIHGMFQNPLSWENWIKYFEQRGYKCLAPAWPYHEGDPRDLRNIMPEELPTLGLQEIIDKYVEILSFLPDRPVVIGHSVGGLIVQSLVSKGLAESGIAIASVAPNAMLSFDLGMLKNAFSIINPIKGNEPFVMTEEGFHASFCNTLSKEEAYKAYLRYATHDSRNVLRDSMMEAGKIDLAKPHAPLLLIAAEKDEIVPAKLVRKNFDSYSDADSITGFKEFPNRDHFICGDPGWEEVAAYTEEWIHKYVLVFH